jgi:hypothetical protein
VTSRDCDFERHTPTAARMPVANKKWFTQTEELSTDLAKKLSTSSFGIGSLETLESLGWDGKSVAAIGLELTPDNRRVKRSQFLLLGALSREPVGLAANKLFPDADPAITMTTTIPPSLQRRHHVQRPPAVRVVQAFLRQGREHHFPHRLGGEQNQRDVHASCMSSGQSFKHRDRAETEDDPPPLTSIPNLQRLTTVNNLFALISIYYNRVVLQSEPREASCRKCTGASHFSIFTYKSIVRAFQPKAIKCIKFQIALGLKGKCHKIFSYRFLS